MPTGTANLMERIYDLLTEVYTSTTGGGAFLAFEKLGVPISSGMFKLAQGDATPSPALAVERLSEIANAVLTVEGDSVLRSSRQIDDMVQLMLLQAMPTAADQMAPFGATKGIAGRAFDNTLASLEGAFQYHPVYASPADWYVPESSGNWTLHSADQQQTQTPPTIPPRPVPVSTPSWHVLPIELQPMLAQPVTRIHPLMETAVSQAPAAQLAARPQPTAAPYLAMRPAAAAMQMIRAMPATALRAAPAIAPSAAVVASAVTARAATPAAMPLQNFRPLMLAQATAQLTAAATTQPVSSDSIDIGFEHCVVTLTRHWFPEVFLLARNWYLPGYKSASFSGGTGIGDTGLLPLLASGFVAIRNLRISAKWSAQEQATVQGSAAFGPFSLIGRSFDASSGTLTCPGMQIIGWFLEALPVLPPGSDPALAASTPTTATASGGSGSAASPPTPGAASAPSSPTAGATPAPSSASLSTTPGAAS